MKPFKKSLFLLPAFCLAMFLLFQWSCKKEDPVVPPEISTIAITEITTTSAKSGGNVISDGGGAITARGLVWRTSTGPTLEQHTGMNNEGTGTGIFSSDIDGLSPNVQYFVRAFATNSAGIVYGNELQFTTNGVTATVTTADITNVTPTTATGGGNVIIDGNPSVTARGIVWNTESGPTIETKLGMTNDGAGSGSFTSNLTALEPKTTYYVRAYATNIETSYGEEKSFETQEGFIDSRDGSVYKTVTIGIQVWMAENLAYLPGVVGPGTGSQTTPYYYVYGYNGTIINEAKATANYDTYGVLYNWPAAMAGSASGTDNPSGVQGVCPTGWHLPSDDEWLELENYLADNGYNYDGTTGGGGAKIAKSIADTSGWSISSTTGAVGNTDYPTYRNKSSFTALSGGYRGNSGTFYNIGKDGLWWSATEISATYTYYRSITYTSSNVDRYFYDKEVGFSVRCVRD